MLDLRSLDFEKGGGTITVVVQDAGTGSVLMVAHTDREALERTITTGEMHYRSRSRGLWHKGATSGSVQRVVSLTTDCDGDAILARVAPAGPACHTGTHSCFGAPAMAADALAVLDATIAARAASGGGSGGRGGGRSGSGGGSSPPPGEASAPSYTRRLLGDRNLRLKKLGEESAELITALSDGDARHSAEEGADLVYHLLVCLHAVGASLSDLRRVLAGRASGGEPDARPG